MYDPQKILMIKIYAQLHPSTEGKFTKHSDLSEPTKKKRARKKKPPRKRKRKGRKIEGEEFTCPSSKASYTKKNFLISGKEITSYDPDVGGGWRCVGIENCVWPEGEGGDSLTTASPRLSVY